MGAHLLAIVLGASSEPVGLTLEAPPCASVEQVRAAIEELGARAAEAGTGGSGRSLDVRIVPTDHGFEARLEVGSRQRVVTTKTCAEATRAAALMVTLALEEAVEPEPAAQRTPAAPTTPTIDATPISLWAAPAEPPQPMARAPGSGGLAVLGTYGRSQLPETGMHVAGVRALAVARVYRGMRIGGAMGFASETDRERTDGAMHWRSNGWSLRSGAVIAWGAPWNDSVVGFAGEAGIAVGRQSGKAERQSSTGSSCFFDPSLTATCYDASHPIPRSVTFVNPYLAGTLVFQVPWRAPVRPIAALGVVARAGGVDSSQLGYTGELGLAWQAW